MGRQLALCAAAAGLPTSSIGRTMGDFWEMLIATLAVALLFGLAVLAALAFSGHLWI
jgi:hypothetical protein